MFLIIHPHLALVLDNILLQYEVNTEILKGFMMLVNDLHNAVIDLNSILKNSQVHKDEERKRDKMDICKSILA